MTEQRTGFEGVDPVSVPADDDPAGASNPGYADREAQRAVNRAAVEARMQTAIERRPAWADRHPDAAAGSLAPLSLPERYAGEKKSAAWRGPGAEHLVTHYEEDAQQRDEMRARIDQGGLLLDSDGQPLTGRFGWVMDPGSQNLYLFPENAAYAVAADGSMQLMGFGDALAMVAAGQMAGLKVIHHSTPLAGMPVQGAGILEVRSGELTMLNDSSGHYRPDAAHMHSAIKAMDEQHIRLSHTETVDGMTGQVGMDIQLTGGVSADGRPIAKEWVADDPSLPQGTVHLRPEQFLQTEGNEQQIRRKIALNAAIQARRRDDDDDDGDAVSDAPAQQVADASGAVAGNALAPVASDHVFDNRPAAVVDGFVVNAAGYALPNAQVHIVQGWVVNDAGYVIGEAPAEWIAGTADDVGAWDAPAPEATAEEQPPGLSN